MPVNKEVEAAIRGLTYNALNVLARTVWGEARGEPYVGKMAVAWVVLNRVASPRDRQYGRTVLEVCLKPLQFSCWNGAAGRELNEKVNVSTPGYIACLRAACEVLDTYDRAEDPTRGATHYYAHDVIKRPSWAATMRQTAVLGGHTFFREE